MMENLKDLKENDRYEKIENLFALACDFATVSRFEGISIKDIQNNYGVSRSTAIRMKSVIDRVFGLEEIQRCKDKLQREKKWYLSSRYLKDIISILPEEIAQLESCKEIMKNTGHSSAMNSIEMLINKLKIITNKKISEIDIEAVLNGQGYAIRQAPKTKVPVELLEKISNAILAMKCLEFEYPSSKIGLRKIKVHPYGIVYGTNVNLLAHNVNDEDGKLKYYTLSKMSNAQVLEDEYYVQDEKFSLQEYLKNSFGIYQDNEPINVKLKFDKSVAHSVLNYSFHPSQEMKQLENGDVIVTFRACGVFEMCWHFFTWGKNCQILEPQELKDSYKKMLLDALDTIK